jgi:hypothetical protein
MFLRRTGFACLAVVVMMTTISAQRQRDWDDLYNDAKELVQKAASSNREQDWKAAEAILLQAIKSGPASGRNVIRRSFGRTADYFPEFYLGLIYLYTNRPADAQIQFQIARKRDIDLNEREFQRLPEYEARAKDFVDAAAKENAAALRQQQFKQALTDAQRLLMEGRFDEAEKAGRAARSLGVNHTAADTVLQNIEKARRVNRLQDILRRNPSLPELRKLWTEYADSGVPGVEELRRRIDAGEAIERRNVAERAAMLAFYNGQYTQSVSALAEAEKASALSPRGQFYRAVVLATQATRGKEVNQALLQRARQAWQAANQSPDAFKADLRYISPQILRLLRGS